MFVFATLPSVIPWYFPHVSAMLLFLSSNWIELRMLQQHHAHYLIRWWFQIFLIFIPTWGNDPIWRAYFFRWVGSTTQLVIHLPKNANTNVSLTSRWWHVGDDLATDVAAAARLGLRTPRKMNGLEPESFHPGRMRKSIFQSPSFFRFYLNLRGYESINITCNLKQIRIFLFQKELIGEYNDGIVDDYGS